MNISLTPQLENLIRSKVESGYYSNASEVVREALRMMNTWEELQNQAKLEHIRTHIAQGRADIANGRYTSLPSEEDIAELFSRTIQGS